MTVRSHDEIRIAILAALKSVAPEIDPAAIAADQPLREQIDIDSFDFLNVIIRLNESLGVDIPEKDYAELATLDGATRYLASRCAAASR